MYCLDFLRAVIAMSFQKCSVCLSYHLISKAFPFATQAPRIVVVSVTAFSCCSRRSFGYRTLLYFEVDSPGQFGAGVQDLGLASCKDLVVEVEQLHPASNQRDSARMVGYCD
jgi:hypothetical protein